MPRSSPSRSSKYKKSRRRRSRSRSRDKYKSRKDDKYYKSSRKRYSSSESDSDSRSYKSRSRSDRKYRRSSSTSSYESQATEKKPKVVEKSVPKKVEPEVKETVFESVNFLHDKDKKIALDELDENSFVPKSFSSTVKKENDVPSVKELKIESSDESILHPNLFGDDDGRMDRWVKKLFLYRQKASVGEI